MATGGLLSSNPAPPPRPGLGVAVILTNDYVRCPDARWGPLLGTKEDATTWRSALEGLFFSVHSYSNLTRNETIQLLHSVSEMEMPDSGLKQYLVFVYCGHGVKDYIICQDGLSLGTDVVCQPFLQHRGGTAVAKLLFFDACRGEKRDRGKVFARSASEPASVLQVGERGGTSAQGNLMPSEGNYLMVFSTLPDYIAQELSGPVGSSSHGMWSQMFASKLPMCNKSLTSLIADVNNDMVQQCRLWLSWPDSPPGAGFQVAEICQSTLIGDVNLWESARQLWQVFGRAPQMPSVAPQPQLSPPPSPPMNYRHRFNNDFKQRYKLSVTEKPLLVEEGYIFSLSVEWGKMWYSEASQCRPTKEEAKEEACRLMVGTLEQLIAAGQEHTSAQPAATPPSKTGSPPMSRPEAPPPSQTATPPMIRPVAQSGIQLAPPMPRPHAWQTPLVMSRGAKKYQEILNECRQKVGNAGGRWSLTGEPENVAQSTFECQLMLDVTLSSSAGATTQLHLVSERVRIVGKKSESRERAAKDLVGQLESRGVLQLQLS